MIQIPLEIGDIILAGRFKNKKIKVKEISFDEYGLPTVNGRGIMKIRIQKLIKPKVEENIVKGRLKENAVAFDIGPTKPCRIKKEDGTYWIYRVNNRDNSEVCASNTGYESKESAERAAQLKGYVMVDAKGNVQEYEFAKVSKNADARSADYKPKQTKIEYIEEIVRKIVHESKVSKKKLNEALDAKVEAKLDELAELQIQLEEAQAKMKAVMDQLSKDLNIKAMEKRYAELLKGELWGFMEQMKHQDERIIRTKKYFMEIQKYQAEVLTYDNVKTLEYAMTQVNQDVKYNILTFQKGTEKLTKRVGDISIQKLESRLNESGWLQRVWKALGNLVAPFLQTIKAKNANIDKNLDTIGSILKSARG